MNYETLREEFESEWHERCHGYNIIGDGREAETTYRLEQITDWWLSKIEAIEKETEARTVRGMLGYINQYDKELGTHIAHFIKAYAASRGVELKD